MLKIEAENPKIEKTIQRLVGLVEEGGGGLHSSLIIKNTGVDLSLHASKATVGKEIIRLTSEVLLPSNKFKTDVEGEDFILHYSENSALSDLQKKLIECMVELYNETGKAKSFREDSFFLSVISYPELIEMILQGRKLPPKVSGWLNVLEKDFSEKSINNFVSNSFFQSRYLGYHDPKSMSEDRVVMPIIDFMNHNWFGAQFTIAKGVRTGDLTVACSQPLEDTTECFAFYGLMDAFDTMINYNFVDESAPIVRSVPLNLEVPGYGCIEVDNRAVPAPHKKLHKQIADLRRYLPRFKYEVSKKQLNLTHLYIPIEKSPLALKRVLAVALQQVTREEGGLNPDFANPWIQEAERKIIAQNMEYYQRILTAVQGLSKKGENKEQVCLNMLEDVAKVQLDKLSRYPLGDNKDNKKAS